MSLKKLLRWKTYFFPLKMVPRSCYCVSRTALKKKKIAAEQICNYWTTASFSQNHFQVAEFPKPLMFLACGCFVDYTRHATAALPAAVSAHSPGRRGHTLKTSDLHVSTCVIFDIACFIKLLTFRNSKWIPFLLRVFQRLIWTTVRLCT